MDDIRFYERPPTPKSRRKAQPNEHHGRAALTLSTCDDAPPSASDGAGQISSVTIASRTEKPTFHVDSMAGDEIRCQRMLENPLFIF